MIDKKKRKEMENLIYGTFDRLDPSGSNTKMYKERFSKLSDTQFDSFFKAMFNDEHSYLTLDIVTYEREPTIDNIESAAKFLNVPLYEKVAFPHMSTNPETPFVTPYEVPVGYIHLKKLQQMLREWTLRRFHK